MVASRVDAPLLQGFADDLADAPGRQPLLARDRGIGQTLTQSREDPRAPQRPAMRVEPPLCSGNRLLNHLKARLLSRGQRGLDYGKTAWL